MLSCLLWCFGREINNRHFEDCKRTLEELKSFFFFFFLIYYIKFVFVFFFFFFFFFFSF